MNFLIIFFLTTLYIPLAQSSLRLDPASMVAPSFSWCPCENALKETRLEFNQKIIEDLVKIPTSDDEAVLISSFGSGGGLQEALLIKQIRDSELLKGKNLIFHFIDTKYRSPDLYPPFMQEFKDETIELKPDPAFLLARMIALRRRLGPTVLPLKDKRFVKVKAHIVLIVDAEPSAVVDMATLTATNHFTLSLSIYLNESKAHIPTQLIYVLEDNKIKSYLDPEGPFYERFGQSASWKIRDKKPWKLLNLDQDLKSKNIEDIFPSR